MSPVHGNGSFLAKCFECAANKLTARAGKIGQLCLCQAMKAMGVEPAIIPQQQPGDTCSDMAEGQILNQIDHIAQASSKHLDQAGAIRG